MKLKYLKENPMEKVVKLSKFTEKEMLYKLIKWIEKNKMDNHFFCQLGHTVAGKLIICHFIIIKEYKYEKLLTYFININIKQWILWY